MSAEQVIRLIQSLEPSEIEKLFVLIKDYETEVRRRQASVRYGTVDENFKKNVDQVFSENKELLQKLAEFERKELGSTEQ